MSESSIANVFWEAAQFGDVAMEKRIAAVVVTYNRKDMLANCIAHICAQRIACDILVVDNASTDDTQSFLAGLADPRISYRNTGRNLGGAGGFNFGLRWAVEDGYDYVWLMDDDCLPEPDALLELVYADAALQGEYGWLSSRAIWVDGSLCQMNLQRKNPYQDITYLDAPRIPAQMASFVSLFLQAATIRKYGLPIAQFFIWGDDWEYTRRISLEEPCYVVSGSSVVHAMKDATVVNIARDSEDRLERYRYAYRNDVYLYRREGWKGWLWLLLKDVWHCVQVLLYAKQKGKKLKIICRGFANGIGFKPEIEYVR